AAIGSSAQHAPLGGPAGLRAGSPQALGATLETFGQHVDQRIQGVEDKADWALRDADDLETGVHRQMVELKKKEDATDKALAELRKKHDETDKAVKDLRQRASPAPPPRGRAPQRLQQPAIPYEQRTVVRVGNLA
ncbi:unnamed protein product, partial [Prorocentrum cordatum]